DRLGGVDGAAAPDRNVPVELLALQRSQRLLDGDVRRLDVGQVADVRLDALALDDLADPNGQPQAGEVRIGDHEDLAHAEPPELVADLVGRADAELQRRRLPGDDGLVRQDDAAPALHLARARHVSVWSLRLGWREPLAPTAPTLVVQSWTSGTLMRSVSASG